MDAYPAADREGGRRENKRLQESTPPTPSLRTHKLSRKWSNLYANQAASSLLFFVRLGAAGATKEFWEKNAFFNGS
jgi:hypothetical protein